MPRNTKNTDNNADKSTTETSNKPVSKKDNKKKKKLFKTEKVKKYYFRTFYYSFAISFIIFGAVAIFYFLYQQDKTLFGFSERYYERALGYIESDNYNKAEDVLIESIEFDPQFTNGRLLLSDIYIKNGKYDNAIKLLNESISLQPRNENYYLNYITALTSQNKISEAMEFVNGISTNYIVVKLSEKRPGNFVSTPNPGTYDSPINLSFEIPKDSEVYYTLDGSVPSKNSIRYLGIPIKISSGTVTVRAFAINKQGIVSDEYKATYRIYNVNTPYIFKDDKMEQIVRLSINKSTGTIVYGDLEKVKTLTNEIRGGSTLGGGIEKLDDLGAMENLTSLVLKNEPNIIDFEPLYTLKNLVDINLSGCDIDDKDLVSLCSVIWLEGLTLDNNTITNIKPIENLIKLKKLSLANNTISTISSLASLGNLTSLNVSKNIISNIDAVNSLLKLRSLDISENLVDNLSPLSALTLLNELNVSFNRLESLEGINRLTQISTLNIADNKINSLSYISDFTSLINLDISGTSVTNLSAVTDIKTLTTLNVSRTSIKNFSPLSGLKIKNLTASDMSMDNSTLESIATIQAIETLDVSNSMIFDVRALVRMRNLMFLNLSGNYATNFAILAESASLATLNCSNSTISDADIELLERNKITVIKIEAANPITE